MFVVYFLAAFLLIKRLQKSLAFSPLKPKWARILSLSSWGAIGLYIVAAVYFEDAWCTFLGSGVLAAILAYLDKEKDFSSQKSLFRAHYPLVAVGFITGLFQLFWPDFYEKHDNIFQGAIIAAFIWIFGRWATSSKQDAELKLAAERNAELDSLVAHRTTELTRQKNELEDAVKLLQTTQQQLIQSEKLASLGELTAGIAHEIQNPLNFVNNFSEVSMELIDEMEQELANGDKEEAMAIAGDIKQNLEKIRHHGQRADSIVKGMLQHSRASNNTLELTNINTLADEYLRLSYHGLRAKDKSFNAELITHFGEQLPMVNVIPQDIGRVLLNLFTNAFYTVQQKQKESDAGYKPTVELTTRLKKAATTGYEVEIIVKDNGGGIPDNIKDKIMQPFFTTKPTGEGTGLGLSLSYDIIVKAHAGKIDLNSKEGIGTEFIITIPA